MGVYLVISKFPVLFIVAARVQKIKEAMQLLVIGQVVVVVVIMVEEVVVLRNRALGFMAAEAVAQATVHWTRFVLQKMPPIAIQMELCKSHG